MEKHIKTILDFYYEAISAKEFMNYLNAHADLQNEFNKALKKSIPTDSGKPIDYLNSIYSEIGTTKDSPIISTDGKEHLWSDSSKSYLILLYVKEFLSTGDAVCYLGTEEIGDLIITAVTDSDAFYCPTSQVEEYIKNKIIKGMPPVKSLDIAVKYVRKLMREHFLCDKKMPKWLQNCEWAFNENGRPMIFRSQKGNAFQQTYIFYDSISGEEINIIQYN